MKDAIALAESVRDMGYMPEQVQDFYPTPSTISTCMYYCGVDPRTMKPVHVTRSPHEKAMQRALIQYRLPENYQLVKEALLSENRADLIGYGPKCLIPPRPFNKEEKGKKPQTGKKGKGIQRSERKNGRRTSGKPAVGKRKPKNFGQLP